MQPRKQRRAYLLKNSDVAIFARTLIVILGLVVCQSAAAALVFSIESR